ncbi:MAG: RHS repeat domain-containing protein [Ethanoligenens sp.]
MTQTSRPDGSVLTETYDAANCLAGMVDKTSAGDIINWYAYTYDADGNILTETSFDGSTTATMIYDANGRLTSRQVKNSSSAVMTNDIFGLDAAENITNASGKGIGLVNIWNPAGWVMLVASAAYAVSSEVTGYYERKNGMAN